MGKKINEFRRTIEIGHFCGIIKNIRKKTINFIVRQKLDQLTFIITRRSMNSCKISSTFTMSIQIPS